MPSFKSFLLSFLILSLLLTSCDKAKPKDYPLETTQAIVNYYKAVDGYQASSVQKGVFIINAQDAVEFHFISPQKLNSIDIGGTVYKIVAVGNYYPDPEWIWYNVQIPQYNKEEIIKHQSISVNGTRISISSGLQNNQK